MHAIKKNIAYQFTLAIIVASLLFIGLDQIFSHLWPAYGQTSWRFLIVTALLAVFSINFYFFILHRPLHRIFDEMKALLTGHQYKKIFTSRIDEVGVLAHFFNEVTKNIERISIDIAEGKRLSHEISIATEIQNRIIPKQIPQVPGIEIYGTTRPATEVGGDSFDVIKAGDNVFVYVGDVTGHGLPAALIMVMVNTMVRTYSEVYQNGYDIMVNTNRLLKQRIEPRRFMTCVLLRFDQRNQRMFYTGCGHEHILVYRAREGICEVRRTGGIALGMVEDITKIVKEEPIQLDAGDTVVLYSDGVVEAKNIQGEMFGLKRLQDAVARYASTATAEELFGRISKDFGTFVGEQFQEDDITLIALKRKP